MDVPYGCALFECATQVGEDVLAKSPFGKEFSMRVSDWAMKLQRCQNHPCPNTSAVDFMLATGTRSRVRDPKLPGKPWILRDTSFPADAQCVQLGKEVNTCLALVRWASKQGFCPFPMVPQAGASTLTLIRCSKYVPQVLRSTSHEPVR